MAQINYKSLKIVKKQIPTGQIVLSKVLSPKSEVFYIPNYATLSATEIYLSWKTIKCSHSDLMLINKTKDNKCLILFIFVDKYTITQVYHDTSFV